MNRLDKIEREAQKAREKIAAMQDILKKIEGQRTEQENLQIVHQIRNLKLSRDELYSFLRDGALPAPLAAMIGGEAVTTADTEPETVYTRHGNKTDVAPTIAGGDTEMEIDEESEGKDDEE